MFPVQTLNFARPCPVDLGTPGAAHDAGLPVPAVRALYACKREADRVGVPFGHFFDPVGDPVGNATKHGR